MIVCITKKTCMNNAGPSGTKKLLHPQTTPPQLTLKSPDVTAPRYAEHNVQLHTFNYDK